MAGLLLCLQWPQRKTKRARGKGKQSEFILEGNFWSLFLFLYIYIFFQYRE